MSAVIEADRTAADPTFEPCDCGSGLRAGRCCKLNFSGLPRTEDSELLAGQTAQMQQAYTDGERRLAEHLAQRILEEAPGRREALGMLFNVCRDEGRIKAAETLVRRLAVLHFNDPTSQAVAAQFFLMLGNAGAAMPFGRMLVRLAPQAAISHITMGHIFNGMSHGKSAEHHFRCAMALDEGKEVDLDEALGQSLRHQGRFAEAREAFAGGLEKKSENLPLLLSAAMLEEADRKFDAADALLARAEAVAPQGPRVAMSRATLLRRQGDLEGALGKLDGLDARFAEVGMAASSLQEKGQVLDALGRYGEAFEAFAAYKQKTREMTGHAYAAEAAADLVARLKEFFTEGRAKLLPRASLRTDMPQPIFVVGFPRSGTTLVEQTLASHPSIAAGDELQTIHGMAERMQALLQSPGPYPVAMSELWLGDRAGQIDTLRDHYLNEAARVGAIDFERRWFTDKMPLNETHLGLIGLLFSQSPIIHLVRHPLDVVLSVFSNTLTHGYNCALELETAARHYALIAELIQHYLAVMPFRYKAVRYEDLVTNQEWEVRELLDFIGEPFDARMLNFHENQRPARTASYAQVTEKLYDRSRYRYRNYLRQLEPVIPILEPAIARLGYTI